MPAVTAWFHSVTDWWPNTALQGPFGARAQYDPLQRPVGGEYSRSDIRHRCGTGLRAVIRMLPLHRSPSLLQQVDQFGDAFDACFFFPGFKIELHKLPLGRPGHLLEIRMGQLALFHHTFKFLIPFWWNSCILNSSTPVSP